MIYYFAFSICCTRQRCDNGESMFRNLWLPGKLGSPEEQTDLMSRTDLFWYQKSRTGPKSTNSFKVGVEWAILYTVLARNSDWLITIKSTSHIFHYSGITVVVRRVQDH
jgi:hypothetical protein